MPKTLKIFISSTFRDMNAERDVLIKNVFPRLRERAEELGVFIREVDLRWGVTEEQARRGEALEICLEGIEECRPYFVCMLGKRYGWIPPPDVIRVDDFTKALGNTAALTETDIALLRSFYRKAGEEERVFTLDRQRLFDITDPAELYEIQEKLQTTLERAGVPGSGESITEKEINHAVLKSDVPQSIPELDELIESWREARAITDRDAALLARLFVRTSGERVWRLVPGPSVEDLQDLAEVLERANYHIDVHSFFYFRQDVGEDHPHYIESEKELKAKLDQLKSTIEASDKAVVKATYPCSWRTKNLERGLHPVEDLKQFEEQVFDDLWHHIQNNSQLQAEIAHEGSVLDIEQEHQSRFIDTRTYNFRGRTQLLAELETRVARALDGSLEVEGDATQHVMVVGEPGAGKSALLAQFFNNYRQKNVDDLVIPKFIGATARSTDPFHILADICGLLDREVETAEEQPVDLEGLRDRLIDQLHRVNKRVVIILDAVNQLRGAGQTPNLQWLPEILPDNVCVVVSVVSGGTAEHRREDQRVLDAMRRRAVRPSEIAVGKLSKQEREDVISSYLDLFNKQLAPDMLRMLASKDEAHNPLYLSVALEELRIFSSHEELVDFIANRLPGSVVEIFDFALARIESDLESRFEDLAYPDLFRRFVVFIAVGRGGMSEDDLRLLLGRWEEVDSLNAVEARLPAFVWGEIKRSMREYLFTRGVEWDFFHVQLEQAVARRYLSQPSEMQLAHRIVADYLKAMGYGHTTTVMNLPYHLIQAATAAGSTAEEWQLLESVLTALSFVETKCQAGFVHELKADFAMARIEGLPIPPQVREQLAAVERAIALHTTVLATHPDLTFSQIVPELIAEKATRAIAEKWTTQHSEPFLEQPPREATHSQDWREVRVQEIPISTGPLGPLLVNREGDTAALLLNISELHRSAHVAELRRARSGQYQLSRSVISLDGAAGGEHLYSRPDQILKLRYPDFLDGSGLEASPLSIECRYQSNSAELEQKKRVIPSELESSGVLAVTMPNGDYRIFECFEDSISTVAVLDENTIAVGSPDGELRLVDLASGAGPRLTVSSLGISKICAVPGSRTCVFATTGGMLGYLHPDESIASINTPHRRGIRNCVVIGPHIVTLGGDFGIRVWSLETLAKQAQVSTSQQRVRRTCLSTSGTHVCMQLEPAKADDWFPNSERSKELSKLSSRFPWELRMRKGIGSAFAIRLVDASNGLDVELDHQPLRLADVSSHGAFCSGEHLRAVIIFRCDGKEVVRAPALSMVLEDFYFSPDGRFVFLFFLRANGFVVVDLEKADSHQFPSGSEISGMHFDEMADGRFLDHKKAGRIIGEIRRRIVFSPDGKEALYYNHEQGLCRITLDRMSYTQICRPAFFDPANEEKYEAVQCYTHGLKRKRFLVGTDKHLHEVKGNRYKPLLEGCFVDCGALPQHNVIWAVTYRGVLRVIGKKGPEYIHDDVLALTPEPSRDGNHLIAVGLNGRLNIIDVAKRSPVLKYGFEGVPPKVFGATGGLVMAHIDGTTRNMRVQRIRGWS